MTLSVHALVAEWRRLAAEDQRTDLDRFDTAYTAYTRCADALEALTLERDRGEAVIGWVEPVAYRTKDYQPWLEGGFAWKYSELPDSDPSVECDSLYLHPAPAVPEAKQAGVRDEMAERLAKFIYDKEARNCKTVDLAHHHAKNWRRAIPEAREMLEAALKESP